MKDPKIPITIITPTTGKKSLLRLLESLKKQKISFQHLLIWDSCIDSSFSELPHEIQTRENSTYNLESEEFVQITSHVILPHKLSSPIACGSALRAVGLMVAKTQFVTFADDDVWFEENHLISLLQTLNGYAWAFSLRKIWDENYTLIGEDTFESVGEDGIFDYKMVDNSSMIFDRRFGTSAAVLYRETQEYNDDRLMYDFLKKHAGNPGKTNIYTVNQVCPKRLENFFRINCAKASKEI